MKCRNPDCEREACDVPPAHEEVSDVVEGLAIRNIIVIDEAKDADGYCCCFCRWAHKDQKACIQHLVRCTRRFKGLDD